MLHLIRFIKCTRGIVFSLRRAIVARGRKLKSFVRRTFYATLRRSERQKVQHMRAAIYRAALHAANWLLRHRRYESVTSRYDSFLILRHGLIAGANRESLERLARIPSLEALFNFHQLSIGQVGLTTD